MHPCQAKTDRSTLMKPLFLLSNARPAQRGDFHTNEKNFGSHHLWTASLVAARGKMPLACTFVDLSVASHSAIKQWLSHAPLHSPPPLSFPKRTFPPLPRHPRVTHCAARHAQAHGSNGSLTVSVAAVSFTKSVGKSGWLCCLLAVPCCSASVDSIFVMDTVAADLLPFQYTDTEACELLFHLAHEGTVSSGTYAVTGTWLGLWCVTSSSAVVMAT